MKRICHVLWNCNLGGVERQAERLACELVGHGVDNTLIVIGSTGPALERMSKYFCEVIILESDFSKDCDIYTKLSDALSSNFDCAIIYSTSKLAVVSSALKSKVSRQLFHAGNPACGVWDAIKQLWRSLWYRRSAHAVVAACSQYVCDSLRKDLFFRFVPLGVAANAVDIPSCLNAKSMSSVTQLGMVARLDEIKDHSCLLKALEELQLRGHCFHAHLVGDGLLRKDLEYEARLLKLEDAVTFHGNVSDVYRHLLNWDIFLFSTTAKEGFGIAIAEAMACGLPCVLSDVGPTREVGGDACAYFQASDCNGLADSIEILMHDQNYRRHLGVEAAKRANRMYSAQASLKQYLSLIGRDLDES